MLCFMSLISYPKLVIFCDIRKFMAGYFVKKNENFSQDSGIQSQTGSKF